MTTQAPLEAGEWFNFRHVQELNILSHTTNTVRLRYDDAVEEVVRLASTAQLRTLHEILETRSHPAPPSGGTGRKAGSWVNLRGVVACKEGPPIEGSGERVLLLTYDDGAADDAVVLSPEQADEVAGRLAAAS